MEEQQLQRKELRSLIEVALSLLDGPTCESLNCERMEAVDMYCEACQKVCNGRNTSAQ